MAYTNQGLVAHAKAQLGHPYWYGTKLWKPTESLLISKRKQYPSHYGDSRMSRYRKDIAKGDYVTDCSGLITSYLGIPAQSANGLYTRAKVKGGIKTLPEVPGLLLHRDGHIGVYIGSGYAIEARGFAYGVVKTRVKDRNWTGWCYWDAIDYVGTTAETVISGALGDRMLRKGHKGSDVKALQQLLLDAGYLLPKYGADGDFGDETDVAVRAYQTDAGLEVDGVAGPLTLAALLSEDEDSDEEDSAPAQEVMVTVGSWYIRTGPGTQYSKVGVAHGGDKLTATGQIAGGWMPVMLGGEARWISGKAIA